MRRRYSALLRLALRALRYAVPAARKPWVTIVVARSTPCVSPAFAAFKYSAMRLAPYGVAGEDPGVQRGRTAALVGLPADLVRQVSYTVRLPSDSVPLKMGTTP
jgi:hypothetical protein